MKYRNLLAAAALGGAVLFTGVAYADDHGDRSPEQRKEHWESLSDSEKVKMIEEKRQQRIKEMNAKWESMSDAEKIKFVEEQRRHHGGPDAERDGERRGPRRPARDSDSE